MTEKRVFAIINPRAGNSTCREEITNRFRRSYSNLSCSFPKNQKQTTHITRQALEEGYDIILTAGGDGTLHDVVNGFFTTNGTLINPKALLELCPSGTANDFVRSLPEENDRINKCDVGILHTSSISENNSPRFFINICDIGLGALIASRVNSPGAAKRNFSRYIAEALRQGLFYKAQPVTLQADNKEFKKKVKMIAVANGTTFGNGLCIAPQANPCDGFFDLVILGDINYFSGLKYLWHLTRGRFFKHPEVEYHRVKTVKVSTPEKMIIEADGEIIGSGSFKASILPRKLPLRIYRDEHT